MTAWRLVRAWSSERILLRDHQHVIVDKPAGVPCGEGLHGADTPHGDLRERLARHGCGPLQSWFTPPARASGVALLGTSPPDRALWALGAITYVVAVDGFGLASRGQLRLKEQGAAALLDYRVLQSERGRALIEVRAELSPERVLRAFAEHGEPVVGDTETPAPAATRLMLHVSSISSPVPVTAPLPTDLQSWLLSAPVRSPTQFAEALCEAALSRYDLWPGQEAFFLLSEGAGEVSGLSVERYGQYAVIAFSSDEAWELRAEVADWLMDHGAQGVYVKRRVRADLRGAEVELLAPSAPLRGTPAPSPLCLRQGPFSFWVELGTGLATGLFLDQRQSWLRLHDAARDGDVLNLFSYTGAFSVAAAAGGAAHTTSVDLSGRALTRLGQNLALNGLSGQRHRLLKSDVPRWLARAGRAGQRFDWIVLDPPSFGTRSRGVLSTSRDYASLVRGAALLLKEGGRLLCVSHHRKISQADLADVCARELERLGSPAAIERLVGPWDCATLPGVSATQSVLARRT